MRFYFANTQEIVAKPEAGTWEVLLPSLHLMGLLGIDNSQNDQLPVGLISQLVEHCSGITEVKGSNPVQPGFFFRLSFRNFLSCIHNCNWSLLIHLFFYLQFTLMGILFTNSQNDHFPVGLIAQSVEYCTGIAEVMGSSPVQAYFFSKLCFQYHLL